MVRHLTATEQTARWRACLNTARKGGFNYTDAPLMSLALARCSDDRYYFLWSHHHALFDGWCAGLILRDVFTAYTALKRGERVALSATRPYRDYVAWLGQQDPTRRGSGMERDPSRTAALREHRGVRELSIGAIAGRTGARAGDRRSDLQRADPLSAHARGRAGGATYSEAGL